MALNTGPIPKRSEELIRRNIPAVPVDKIKAIGIVEIPDLGIEEPHPLVVDMYESLKKSAQKKYYEPSDWQYARLTLHFVNKLVWASKPSAQMLASVNSMLTALLMTEGDRRRVRIEVERNQDADQVATVISIADRFAAALGAQNKTGSPEGG